MILTSPNSVPNVCRERWGTGYSGLGGWVHPFVPVGSVSLVVPPFVTLFVVAVPGVVVR